jgi:hypothetical protein
MRMGKNQAFQKQQNDWSYCITFINNSM